jgi:hypothetical protein
VIHTSPRGRYPLRCRSLLRSGARNHLPANWRIEFSFVIVT